MTPADRKALLGRMKESGGGQTALLMEFYDLLRAAVELLERIATAVEGHDEGVRKRSG